VRVNAGAVRAPRRRRPRGAGAAPVTSTGDGRAAERALFDRVFSVLGTVAEQAAGQPTWRVKPALRRAWRDVFDAELGEPTLTWVAQAIQDRQRALIRWRTPEAGDGVLSIPRHATGDHSRHPPSGTGFPGEWRHADVKLPATTQTLLPELLHSVLSAWGSRRGG
jgi:hypothetical protein